MKILDVQPFHEGIQRNLVMLQRLGDEMEAIRKTIEGLAAMDDSLKGEGGNAIRSFYEECHLPFLQFHSTFQKNFISILEGMDDALDALEPDPSGFIRESFLEGEIEQGLTEIAQITESLTDEANSIMDQVADIVGLPHLDDSDVQEGVKRAKIKRDDTVTALHEFDTNQTDALMPIETDLATMDSWLSDIESLFTDGTTDIDFTMERWAALSAQNSLKTDLAHRTAEMAGVIGSENVNHQPGRVLNALLAGQDPFQLTNELVDGPTAYSLYDSYIFTTFPGMASRARLRRGSATEEESGFLYSLEKSWESVQEIGHDSVEGFKARRGKAYDSIYDFTNYVTLGASDAIWSGAKDRTAKRKDSVGDYLDYLTLGFTGTIAGAVNPDDPFSKDHWLNSFGLATSITGAGKVVTTKPTSGVSEASKPKETGQSVRENIVSRETGEGSRLATSRTIISTEMESKILEGRRKVPKNNLIGGHSARINNANDNFAVEVLSTNFDGTKSVIFTKQFRNGDISKLKKSTLFPESWSDERILKNIIEVGNTPALSIRLRDRATWHRGTINGIEIDVIKIGNDVTSGYPTGVMNAPRPSGF